MRRDVISILIITAIVVAATLLVGPYLAEVRTGPPRIANSIPIPLKRDPASVAEPAPTPARFPLNVEVRDSATGNRIEKDTAITIAALDGTSLQYTRGFENGLAVGVSPPSMPVVICATRVGYVDAYEGPIVWIPGSELNVLIDLQPLLKVDIRPRMPGEFSPREIAVMTATLPGNSSRERRRWDSELYQGVASFRLSPGKYWCYVPMGRRVSTRYDLGRDWINPSPWYPNLQHAEYRDGFVFSFDVIDKGLTLEPEATLATGECELTGQLTNADGDPCPDVGLWAVRCSPSPFQYVAGVVDSDLEGRFTITGLAPGVYRLQPETAKLAAYADSVKIADLRDVTDASVNLRMQYPPEAEQWWGTAEVRVLKNGVPLEDAKIRTGYNNRLLVGEDRGDGWRYFEKLSATDMWIHTEPWTLQSFTLPVRAGLIISKEFEIAPEGTGALQASARLEGSRLREVNLTRQSDRFGEYRTFRKTGHDDFTILGIPPGSYDLTLTYDNDEAPVNLHYVVEIAPDETTLFDRYEKSAFVAGTFPDKKGGRIYLRREGDGLVGRGGGWSVPSGDAVRFGIDGLPRGKFLLCAYLTGPVDGLAVARVDTTNGDAEVIEWVHVLCSTVAAGGIVRVEAPDVRRYWSGYATLYLAGNGLQRFYLGSLDLKRRGDHLVAEFPDVQPGKWRVILEGDDYLPLEAEVELTPGERTTVRLRRDPEVSNRDWQPPLAPKVWLPPRFAGEASPPPPVGPGLVVPGTEVVPEDWRTPESRIEWVYLTGASESELMAAVVFAHRDENLSNGEYIEHRRRVYPYARLRMAHGRPVLVIERLTPSTASIEVHVPGCKVLTIDLSTPARARWQELERN